VIRIQDSAPVKRFPVVNMAIVTACAASYVMILYAQWVGEGTATLNTIIDRYGLIPARFFALLDRQEFFSTALYKPLFTAPLVHSGLLHFVLNMLFLWVLGDNVEERFGHLKYAAFYAAGSVAAGLAHVVMNPRSVIPAVGASGGIAAVMGAYLILYPRSWITFKAIPPWISLRMPAWFILVGWFILQVFSGLADRKGSSGVAWWAHLGGFTFGCAVVFWRGRTRTKGRKRR